MLQERYVQIKTWYKKHERLVSPLAFAAGFVWDTITLQRIDLLYENITFAWNLFLAILVIVLLNTYQAGRLRNRLTNKVAPLLHIFLQFAFGGLLSAFVVFYIRSGSIFVSWPFLLLLVGLFVGNDFFRERYIKFTFQISILFIALFTYFVFLVPIIIGTIGTWVFLVSGVCALLVISGLLYALFRFLPDTIRQNKRGVMVSIGSIYILFHILYFSNVIPPIPLSVKESGVYHSVARLGQSEAPYLYKVTYEPAPWYMPFATESGTFHLRHGNRIYMYTAIFAPTRIDATVLHRWSFFDENQKKWIERARVPLSIAGGRGKGYRGYTFLREAQAGKWRVDIITGSEQVLGRKAFSVIEGMPTKQLKTELR
jgi:hypothetical protein